MALPEPENLVAVAAVVKLGNGAESAIKGAQLEK